MTLMTLAENGEKALYSIIVPVLNSARTLDDCLRGLVNQSFQQALYEIIVIDDGSVDYSLQIAKCYPVKIIKNSVKSGSYASRNVGIVNAVGKILFFTDATCHPSKDWLLNLLSGFEDDNVGCVGGQILSAAPRTLVQHFCKDRKTHDMSNYLNREIPFFACGNVAIRREVFERVGLFDESLESGGDGDFSFRVKLDGRYRIVFQSNACVYYNHRETLLDLLKQAYKYGQGIARFRFNYYGSPGMNRPISLFVNIVALLRQLAGVLVIPWKIIREYTRAQSLIIAFAYPSIDKLHSLWFHVGIVAGLIKFRGHKRSPIPKLTS